MTDNVLKAFFWLCGRQDAQIQELKEQITTLNTQNEQMQATITQQLSQIQQHKDQYNILKLKLGGFSATVPANKCGSCPPGTLRKSFISFWNVFLCSLSFLFSTDETSAVFSF